MDIHFDKSAIKQFVNDSVEETWDDYVQENAYKQFLSVLQTQNVVFPPEQEEAIKLAFNYVGMSSTKQSLIAMLTLLDKLGIVTKNK